MDADQLRDLVRGRYGDPDDPRFDFVAEAESERPYADLVERLGEVFEVTEDTDLNDDVCFTYVLRDDGRAWVLQLSMVARVAVLLRLLDGERVEVVEPGFLPPGSEEHVASALRDAGVVLLDAATLGEPVDLALFNTDPDEVRLYQALFTDVDQLPWEDTGPGE